MLPPICRIILLTALSNHTSDSACPAIFAQIAPFPGLNGLGYSTITCVDRDGDGYGVGPLAVVNTSVDGAISSGRQSVTPASMSGISVGMRLRIHVGPAMEAVTVTSVTATTFTATFSIAHSSAPVLVSDQGCLSPDADDLYSKVRTGPQAIAKYGTLLLFVKHIGYTPAHIGYIATTRNDGTGTCDDITKPFRSYSAVDLHLAPDTMVMYRCGTYLEAGRFYFFFGRYSRASDNRHVLPWRSSDYRYRGNQRKRHGRREQELCDSGWV